MKKFISMVMAAAMVVSLVPATAFAASGDVVAKSVKVVDAVTDLVEDGRLPPAPFAFIKRSFHKVFLCYFSIDSNTLSISPTLQACAKQPLPSVGWSPS